MSRAKLETYQRRIGRTSNDRRQYTVMLEAARDNELDADELVELDKWFGERYPQAGKTKKKEEV